MSWHVSDHLEPTASDTDASQPIPELLRLGEQLARARALAGVSADDLARIRQGLEAIGMTCPVTPEAAPAVAAPRRRKSQTVSV